MNQGGSNKMGMNLEMRATWGGKQQGISQS